jgi:hypothetical protein
VEATLRGDLEGCSSKASACCLSSFHEILSVVTVELDSTARFTIDPPKTKQATMSGVFLPGFLPRLPPSSIQLVFVKFAFKSEASLFSLQSWIH